jgi:hypothetical protein
MFAVSGVRYVEGVAESLPPIAVLLKEARDAYGVVIRREVERKRMTPLPPNGAFVLGALHYGLSREDIMRQRGQALDKGRALARLVECGYLLDEPDGLHLTASGRECALAVADATSALTTHLNQALGDEGYAHFILGLMTLIDMKEEIEEQ